MPPRPIDSRNVYQKTLHAQYEAEKLNEGLDKQHQMRQRLSEEELNQRARDRVDIEDDQTPTRRSEKDAHREKRRDPKRQPKDENANESAVEDEDDWDGLRKRLPSDDRGKGEKLDVKG